MACHKRNTRVTRQHLRRTRKPRSVRGWHARRSVHRCISRDGAFGFGNVVCRQLFLGPIFLNFSSNDDLDGAHTPTRADTMEGTIHDTLYHSGATDAVAPTGTTRSETHDGLVDNTELFNDVVLDVVLRPGTGSLLSYGLSLVDCARLAAVNKSCRAIVAANECWSEALSVLENAYVFVPVDDSGDTDYSDPDERDPSWRQTLGDPRYATAAWKSVTPMTRYNLLLPYAQEVIAIIKERALSEDASVWDLRRCSSDDHLVEDAFDDDEDEDDYEDEEHKFLEIQTSVIHLLKRHFHRYEILMKLIIAHCLQGGLQGDEFVDTAERWFKGCVMHDRDDFGSGGPSDRYVFNTFIYRVNSGDDKHLEKLNQPIDETITANMFGENVYRSLQVLPLDLDAVGLEVLERRDLIDEDEDSTNWRDIWPWTNHTDNDSVSDSN